MSTEFRANVRLVTDDQNRVEMWWDGKYIGQIIPLTEAPGVQILSVERVTFTSDNVRSWGLFTSTLRIHTPAVLPGRTDEPATPIRRKRKQKETDPNG